MGVLHRVDHLQEQLEALPQTELSGVAILADQYALDVFQRQVRPASRQSRIAEAGNVRMRQASEDVALARESLRPL